MKAPISDFRSYTPFTDFLAGKDEAYRRAWIEAVKTVRKAMDQKSKEPKRQEINTILVDHIQTHALNFRP